VVATAQPLEKDEYGDVEAVLFDVGGVLMTPNPDALRELVRSYGRVPDDAACINALHQATLEMDLQSLPVERMDWFAVNASVARALNIADPDEQLVQGIAEVFREAPYVPVPAAGSVMRELSRRGYRLGVVSNAHGSIEAQLAAARICSTTGVGAALVEIVVDSTLVGVHKPNPAIFDVALRAMGVPAFKTAYVGDSLFFDVHAAQTAGMHAVHVDWLRACLTPGHPDVHALETVLELFVGPRHQPNTAT